MRVDEWTAEGAPSGKSLGCDVGHTSVAGRLQDLRQAHGFDP